jgi:hypothetical protein
MMRDGHATPLLGEPQPGFGAAENEGRMGPVARLEELTDESPYLRTERSSTSVLTEKLSYVSNITWVVDNRLEEGPIEGRRRVLRKRCSQATNVVVRLV